MEPLMALVLIVAAEDGNQINYKTYVGGLSEPSCTIQRESLQEHALPGHYFVCKPETAE